MKIPFPKRAVLRRGVIAGLAVITAAGVVAGRDKPAVEPVEPRAPQVEQSALAPDIDLAKLKRAEAAAPQADPFAPNSFAPPPPVRQAGGKAKGEAQAQAEPPSAPPLPFAYAGKLIQDGKTEVFVLRGEELISIAAGQKIDDEYRVDAISASQIAFIYLPLKTHQSLELEQAGG